MDIFGGSTETLITAFVKARSLYRHLFDIKTMETEKHELSGWVVDLTLHAANDNYTLRPCRSVLACGFVHIVDLGMAASVLLFENNQRLFNAGVSEMAGKLASKKKKKKKSQSLTLFPPHYTCKFSTYLHLPRVFQHQQKMLC